MHSIRWRIVLLHVLLIVLAMVLASVYLLDRWESYYLDLAKHDLELKGNLLRDQDLLSDSDLIEVATVLGFADEKDSLLVVLNQSLQAIVAYGPDIGIKAGNSLVENKPISDLLALPQEEGPFVGLYYHNEEEYISVAIRAGGHVEEQDVGAIFLLQPLSGVYSILQDIKRTLLNATGLAVLVVIVLGLISSRTITKPILEITSQAEKLAAGDFNLSVPVHSRDEIGRLAEVFNYLTGRLRHSLSAMESEKSKLEAILEYMTNGVIAFDSAGQLMHINPKALDLLTLAENTTPEAVLERLRFESAVQMLQMAPANFELELTQPLPLVLRVYLAPFQTALDQASGVVAVLQDMTEQARLDQVRRDFVANVSHELRTPLTTIKSYVETLLDGALEDQPTALRFLEVANNETDRMTRLIKDLLTLSTLDNLKHGQKQILAPAELVLQVAAKMEALARQQGLNLSKTLPQDPAAIWANADEIEQVLSNIVSNAIKFTPAGGNVHIRLEQGEGEVRIFVQDSGLGIPAADLPHIFDRFYRVDKARSRQMGGTGLGLAIARQIIRGHGGQIWAESKINEGTTFAFSLPTAPEGGEHA